MSQLTEWIIYRNMDQRNSVVGRWDLMRLDESIATGCMFPPCDHATAQEAFNCLVVNNGVHHFRLEVLP